MYTGQKIIKFMYGDRVIWPKPPTPPVPEERILIDWDFSAGFTEAQLIADGAENVTNSAYGLTVNNGVLRFRNTSLDWSGAIRKTIDTNRRKIRVETEGYLTYGSWIGGMGWAMGGGSTPTDGRLLASAPFRISSSLNGNNNSGYKNYDIMRAGVSDSEYQSIIKSDINSALTFSMIQEYDRDTGIFTTVMTGTKNMNETLTLTEQNRAALDSAIDNATVNRFLLSLDKGYNSNKYYSKVKVTADPE